MFFFFGLAAFLDGPMAPNTFFCGFGRVGSRGRVGVTAGGVTGVMQTR
jgi:hypothetical protein